MWKVREEETANQRAWKRQRQNPTPCRYGCGTDIVFLKDLIGRTIACEAKKLTFEQNGIMVMKESGEMSSSGRREGWRVHSCIKLEQMKQNAYREFE